MEKLIYYLINYLSCISIEDITTQIKLIAFSTTLKAYPKCEKAEPESPAIHTSTLLCVSTHL